MLKKIMTIGLLVALAQSAYASGSNEPTKNGTGAVKGVVLSDSDIKKLAADASSQYDKSNTIAPPSSPYAQRMAEITKDMKTADGLKLNIKVYLNKNMNAFATADGTVRVFAGLMDNLTDDEITYVIGHEIAHVHLGHSKKALQAAYTALTAGKTGANGSSTLIKLSESELEDLNNRFVNTHFSQFQENVADQYALQFMKINSSNPGAAVSALHKLEEMCADNKTGLSCHPSSPGDTARALEAEL